MNFFFFFFFKVKKQSLKYQKEKKKKSKDDKKIKNKKVVENKEEENYVKFQPNKFGASGHKKLLIPRYCIGGCREGGIDRLGGGRSKCCWHK